MTSLIGFLDRARTLAEGRGVDPFKSPIIDAGMTAEALIPHVIRAVLSKSAVEDALSSTADWSIALIDSEEIDGVGVGTLPDEVLTKFIDRAYLPMYPRTSFTSFADLQRPKFDNLLQYFAVKNQSFYLSGFDSFMGDFVVLNAPSMPRMPADPELPIPLPADVIDDGIAMLAGVLTGEIPLTAILED